MKVPAGHEYQMRVPITVPNIGSVDEPIRLCGWLFDEGDLVLAGDIIAEMLIPGVTFEIVAEHTGRLVEITAPIDSTVHIGDVVGWIDGTVS